MPPSPSPPSPNEHTPPLFDFGAFPVLMTDRLCLCELSADDVADIFAFGSDPVVQLYNSVPHRTTQDTLKFIAEEQENYRQKKEIIWALRRRQSGGHGPGQGRGPGQGSGDGHGQDQGPGRGPVIGTVSVFGWDRYHRRAAMGYDLARDCWGQGLAQEAIRVVLGFAFGSMNLNRMEIWTSAANARSLRLAQRLGFTRDGTLRKRILEDDGQFHDCAVFGLLRAEWPNPHRPGAA